MMALIEEFRDGRYNMDRLNKAYIILIPKVEGAELIGDFRPISPSNSIYLIIAKVLANRLRLVLPAIISPFQSAFLPGRQMSDIIVTAEEIVAAWRRASTPGFLWKVDFSKAYDSIDWRFLWNVIRRRGFPETWIRWVKQCVTTVSFAILVNGRPQGGWIHPQHGIRQGCPLAPLLFILAADALAVCTLQLCSRGHIAGFQSPSIPGGIPLLQYADDTTFFIQGSWAAAHTLSVMMDIFSDFSGLRLNRAKSSFIGFGLSVEEMAGCSRILSTPIRDLPIRYLGVPLADRRLRIRDWQPVLDKVETWLGGWRARLLSRGGRLVMFKAVLSAIPNYFMSIFRMPVGVRRRLEAVMRGFFWRGSCSEEARGMGLVTWETVCRPVSQGGLGVQSLQYTNLALLTKWVSRLLQSLGDLLSVLLQDCYGASLDWIQWQTPQRGDSAFMSSLRPVFAVVQPLLRPKLGSGTTFRFWMDEWSRNGRLHQSLPRLFALASDPECSVRQAWHDAWAPPMRAMLSDQRTSELLRLQELLVDLRPTEGQDGWTWCEMSFSVQAAYCRLRAQVGSEDPLFLRLWQHIWRSRIPLKIRVFLWLLLRRRLMTRSLRQRCDPHSSAECVLCRSDLEDCNHLFVGCPLAQAVWTRTRGVRAQMSSMEVLWRSMADGPYRRGAEWHLIFATLWTIWNHRNEVVFRGRTPSAEAVLHEARGLVSLWNRVDLGIVSYVPI